ncbi:SulP family inorganic anion transporter [Candidatus Marinarcus aquaticus]|uniref:Sulfate permease n=1 Tax=Candidatus Marinarcus aquaticus TaxID=2044504 RepID=A0A4Q0XRX3_9BACT|nr:SulP family inorganic anion transporter [Candidatus Marinarcus aquaticus]RXJ60200.1 sulfate permease [Candidatus Marinarcus aquaticus]
MNNIKNNVLGGITAAVVALPLALAFGVASGAGATAGLYGAIILGFFASLFGGTKTQISGPTGPMTVVIASAVVAFSGDINAVMTVVLIAGILQIAFGVLGIGKWVRYIPYPVISGFMSGIGCIIILLQINPFVGVESSGPILQTIIDIPKTFQNASLPSLIIATLTLVIMFFTPKKISSIIPSALIALVVMTYVSVFFSFSIPTIGEIPTTLPEFILPTTFEFIKLKEVVTFAVTLALLGTIDTLLTSVVADSMTKTKHNSNKELIGQGIGNALCSFVGAIPGAGATMRTVINIKSGSDSNLSGMVHAVTLLVIVLFLAPLASQIPLAVLAGILIKVGFDILDYRFFKIMTKVPRKDLVIMSVVLLLTVFVDLIMAVGVGITIASILSIYHISKHTKFQTKKSKDIIALDLKQSTTKVLKIHGSLFFATSEMLEKRMNKLKNVENIIIDAYSVGFLDLSAMLTLEEIVQHLVQEHKEVYLLLNEANRRKVLKIDTKGVFSSIHMYKTLQQAMNDIEKRAMVNG